MQERLSHKDYFTIDIYSIDILCDMRYCLQCFGGQRRFYIFIRIQSPNPLSLNITVLKSPIELSGMVFKRMLIYYCSHSLGYGTSIIRTIGIHHNNLIRYLLGRTDTPLNMDFLVKSENDNSYRIIHL